VRLLALLVAMVALVAVGCAGGDDDSDSAGEETKPAATATQEAPSATAPAPGTTTEAPAGQGRIYTRSELPQLALQPSDAPKGMRYTRAESGRKTLLEVGVALNTQIRELRRLGFRAVYDAIFDSTSAQSDLRLATRTWLFQGPSGAERWLERTRGNSFAVALEPVRAPRLADGSWAARGNVGGSDIISHAFRAGNVVVLVTFSTQRTELSEAEALAVARKAVTRVRRA
jgi:hypothetical protein